MGQYVAFCATFDRPRIERQLFSHLFSSTSFTPIGLGAYGLRDRRAKRCELRLAGRGLVPFAAQLCLGGYAWGSCEVDPAADPDGLRYLKSIAEKIHSGTAKHQDLDEGEFLDEHQGFTHLRSPKLASETLEWMEDELRDCAIRCVELFGTYQLTANADTTVSDAYRHVVTRQYSLGENLPCCFLSVSARTDGPNAKETDICLMSESTIWLAHAEALGGMVAPSDAIDNIRKLAELGFQVSKTPAAKMIHSRLTLDSEFFRRSMPDFEAAFANIASDVGGP